MKYWSKNITDLDPIVHVKPNFSLLYIDDLTRAMENVLQVDMAILDFEKL